VESFNKVKVKEGEKVVINERDVGNNIKRINWKKDGVNIVNGNDVKINIESGE
jgi:hypothetical protein